MLNRMFKRPAIIALLLLAFVSSSVPVAAQNPVVSRAAYENALVNDAGFISMIDGLITKAATEVKRESGGTDQHAARVAFANKVLLGSRAYAARMAGYIIHLDNFEGQVIQVAPLGSGFVVTIATLYADAYGNVFSVWTDLALLFG